MAWYGMKWSGNFGMKDARMEWKTIFHSRFCAVHLQKNTYRCRVVINNIVTEVFNFNIYAYYWSTNRSTLVVCIAQTVYVLHHCKYIAICCIDGVVDAFDRFDFYFFEIDNLPSPKFCFFTSSRKLVFAISFPFQLNFISIFSFSAYNNSFRC